MHESGNNFPPTELSQQRVAIVAQMLRATATMRNIDELFQWLAYAIVHRFDVQLTQFWTNQVNPAGRLALQLRSMVYQDSSLPEQIVVNDQIAMTAQRMANERHIYTPQPVESIFTQYQTILLKRYGLNYFAGYFIRGNVLLPPPSNAFSTEKPPVLFAMATLLFFRKSPHGDLVPAIGAILEQAVAVAGNYGLLLPVAATPSQSFASQTSPRQEPLPALAELIPRRKTDSNQLLSNNPFASSSVISNKQARRLHAAIDGRTNVANLCEVTGMDMKEVYAALQTLLTLHRIEVYEPGGRLVNASLLLNNR
jgi:hypothetical protein